MASPSRYLETPAPGVMSLGPVDDAVTAKIVILALSRPAFSVDQALAYVGWNDRRRAQMLVVLEHLANPRIDVLRPLPSIVDHYAASARARRKLKSGRATRSGAAR